MGLIASANHTKRELAGLIGRPLRTIQFWTDIGLVIPEILPSRGKGKPRIYSGKNLLEFNMIDIMVAHIGVKLQTIKHIFQSLREGKDITHQKPINNELMLFKDFFENSNWGFKKELTYCELVDYQTKKRKIEEPIGFFHIIQAEEDGNFTFNTQHGLPGTHYPLATNVLWLGSIKNLADKQIEKVLN